MGSLHGVLTLTPLLCLAWKVTFQKQNIRSKLSHFIVHAFMYTSKTRKNYSLYFKKTVLKRVEENNHNIAQTAAEFNIHRKNNQRWTKQTDVLNRAALNRDINTRTAKRIQQGVSPYPLLDVALVDFIKQKREKRLVITGNMKST